MLDSSALRGTETILVVDDEPTILRLFRSILTKYGYHVITASSGVEALKIRQTARAPIQLAVLDIIMPEMNGIELLNRLIRLDPEMSFILMSGYTSNEIMEWIGTDASKQSIMWKPFAAEVLLRSVRTTLDRPHKQVATS